MANPNIRFTFAENRDMVKIKLIKLEEVENPRHPHNIPTGHVVEGEFVNRPEVGECFWVGVGWRTSTVQEVFSEDTFRTYNSIYKVEGMPPKEPNTAEI